MSGIGDYGPDIGAVRRVERRRSRAILIDHRDGRRGRLSTDVRRGAPWWFGFLPGTRPTPTEHRQRRDERGEPADPVFHRIPPAFEFPSRRNAGKTAARDGMGDSLADIIALPLFLNPVARP
jgi:hypothetical protein